MLHASLMHVTGAVGLGGHTDMCSHPSKGNASDHSVCGPLSVVPCFAMAGAFGLGLELIHSDVVPAAGVGHHDA